MTPLLRCGRRARTVTARDLRIGQLVADPDGVLGLHASPVRVVDVVVSDLDPGTLLVDYDVPGTRVIGVFTVDRLAEVWVVR